MHFAFALLNTMAPVMIGGGLRRRFGGWSEVSKISLKGMDRIKGDERMLDDPDFVLTVLSQAKERFERRYGLIRFGYDMLHVADTAPGYFQSRRMTYSKRVVRNCVQMQGNYSATGALLCWGFPPPSLPGNWIGSYREPNMRFEEARNSSSNITTD